MPPPQRLRRKANRKTAKASRREKARKVGEAITPTTVRMIGEVATVGQARTTISSGELDLPNEVAHEIDRRDERRARVLKAGKLVYDRRHSVIDCIIRDISPLGARIRTTQILVIPDELELLVVSDAELHPAKVLWRSYTECGLLFTGSPRSARALRI